MSTGQRRVPAGVPTGGRFAAIARPEAKISLDADYQDGIADRPGLILGEGLARVSVAQVRRDLPVGTRVQVVYPGRPEGEPDVRTVTEQTAGHMWTARPGQDGHVRLDWAGTSAEKDSSGAVTVYRADGSPVATFVPLGADRPGFDRLDDRNPVTAAIRRARTSVDPAELDVLAGHPSNVVQLLVAENRSTPPGALERLARDTDERTARAILRRDHVSRGVALALSDHPAESVRRDVAHHRSTDAGILDVMARQHEECQVLVAENRNASRDTLHWLAEYGTHMAREAAAGNPSTDYQDLDRLACAGSMWAKDAVAGNPSTPEYVLRRLHRDPRAGAGIMAALVRNPSAPEEMVREIARSDDVLVRAAAAGPHWQVLPELVRDGSSRVRRAAAGNRGLSLSSMRTSRGTRTVLSARSSPRTRSRPHRFSRVWPTIPTPRFA